MSRHAPEPDEIEKLKEANRELSIALKVATEFIYETYEGNEPRPPYLQLIKTLEKYG
jgi:hypothetical protein